jgi:hypothetical protein
MIGFREGSHWVMLFMMLVPLALYILGLLWTIKTAPIKGKDVGTFVVFYIFLPLIAFIVLISAPDIHRNYNQQNFPPQ